MGIRVSIAPLRTHGLPIIEDLAQWLGPVFNFEGDIQVFSFEATKVVSGGEGGMALTKSSRLATRLADAKRIGLTPYKLNLFPLSDLQSTLILSQLERLQEIGQRRQSLFQHYQTRLTGLPLTLPSQLGGQSMPFRFPVQLASGSHVEHTITAFARHNVAVRRPVDSLLHQYRPASTAFPVAQQLFDSTISLPLYPALSDGDLDAVLAAAHAVFSHS